MTGVVNIGTTTATGVNIGQAGDTDSILGSSISIGANAVAGNVVNIAGGSAGGVNINNGGAGVTNVGTGGTGAVNVGNSTGANNITGSPVNINTGSALAINIGGGAFQRCGRRFFDRCGFDQHLLWLGQHEPELERQPDQHR